ncbi:DNA internalization-related competence protein ComEC/Rec2 [Thermodesulfobacteriota bacterium]
MSKFPIRQKHLLSLSPGLITIVIFLASGICLAEIIMFNDYVTLLTILSLLCLVFIFYNSKTNFHFLIFYSLLGLLFFLIGQYHAQAHLRIPAAPNHIASQIEEQQTVSLYGVLVEHPAVSNLESGPKTKFLMQVKSFYRDTILLNSRNNKKTSGLVLLTLNGLLPDKLKPGDHFLVKSKISTVNTFSTPGSFNYKKHLANQSIFLKGWIDSPSNILKIQTVKSDAIFFTISSLLYFPERIRHNIANFIDKTLSQPSRGLYKAILIGDRSNISPSVLESFTNAGCIHILAISGMHMGLLAVIIITVITWLLKRSTLLLLYTNVQKIAVSIALIPLIVYALIAGFNIPVLRALLMTTVFILAIIFDRPGNLLNHILLAALLILAWKPAAIFTASFQLSFSAVISIALIYPLLISILFQNHPGSLSGISKFNSVAETTPPENKTIFPAEFLKWLLTAIILTTAAMLGTLPLLLFHFNRISLVAPLSNLLVEPLICTWSLIVGIIACVFIPLSPFTAEILLKAGSFGLTLSEKICAFFSALPFASLRLPTPSLMEIIIFYIFLLSTVMTFHLQKTLKRLAVFIAIFSFFCLLAAPAISNITARISTSTSVSILDVGHGSAIVLQLPHNKNILIDGGGAVSDNFNIGERVIGPFLWKKKINRLDSVVISHPHADHYNGLPFLLTHFHPKELWINDTTGDDPEYKELLNLASKLNIAIKTPETDEVLFQDNNTRLLCLHNGVPEEYATKKGQGSFLTKRLDTNDLSLVLKLETADNSFLFPADISATMANTLISEKRNLQADILLAPHHGSRSSMSFDFIEAVGPEYIAISAGRYNPFNLPDKSFFDLEQKGIQVLTTGRDGTLTFTGEGGKTLLSRYQVN